ncbi:MAG: trigger factor [Chloroherpetonaceae bacterium]
MEKIIIENENGENKLELFLSNEEIKPFLDKAYAEAQKNMKIPGFRPGHVPQNMIKNMYGKAIEADTNIDIVNDYFPRIAAEENIILLSNPNLLDIQKTDEGIKYIIGYQTIPDFQIKDYKDNLTVFEPVHIVQSEEIENKLDELAFNFAEKEPAEIVESLSYTVKFNIITHHHHEEEEEGHDHEDSGSDEIYLSHPQLDHEFRDIFLNRKVNEKFDFTPENDPTHSYEIEITGISRIIPPIIDDELAKKISQNKFDTLEELRNSIELELQDAWDEESRHEMEDQIREFLIQENWDIYIPEQLMQISNLDYLKSVKKHYNIPENETNLDATLLQYAGDMPKKIALWDLLRTKLYKLENVEVEDSDIDAFVEKQKQYFQGLSPEATADIIRKNADLLARLKEDKLFEILLGYATTEEISFDDYAVKKQIQARENESTANTDNDEIDIIEEDDTTESMEFPDDEMEINDNESSMTDDEEEIKE